MFGKGDKKASTPAVEADSPMTPKRFAEVQKELCERKALRAISIIDRAMTNNTQATPGRFVWNWCPLIGLHEQLPDSDLANYWPLVQSHYEQLGWQADYEAGDGSLYSRYTLTLVSHPLLPM